jgi:methylenetetrahydrofolate reductase (NADPH)
MLRVFQTDIADPAHFTVTLELVPGRESTGRAVDTVMGIARDAFKDGRVSAVSITDNPGGNPSLSPDVLSHQIFQLGMDVIVHFTCRDMNRVGMESRALQLALMGMKNILAVTGDYSGRGFGGQGAPVFDLDSVHLQILLGVLTERLAESGDPDGFFTGCAVSPFKKTEGECFAQYAKLCRKMAAGAQFVITQLGYDARKFEELIRIKQFMGYKAPVLGSLYVLTPKIAEVMHSGKVPGAVVTDALLKHVQRQSGDKKAARAAAVERTARLAAVLKGLGYNGIHIGGIHKSFDVAGRILDRLAQIQGQWRDFVAEFDFPQPNGFYAFEKNSPADSPPRFGREPVRPYRLERWRYAFLKTAHSFFFSQSNILAPLYRKMAHYMDGRLISRLLVELFEHPSKAILLHCQMCGDCGIQHVGFLCPESQCPKHIRNGACGGSSHGYCEVFPDRPCVWFRAYRRLAYEGECAEMVKGCVPPRMWELNHTSSWLNFHLGRDHQSASTQIAMRCKTDECRLHG